MDSASGTIDLDYDSLDRLISEASPPGTVTYAYDAAGRRVRMAVAGQEAVTYAYDHADRLTAIEQGISAVAMSYDGADRVTALTLPNGVVQRYTYDAASRVTEIEYRRDATVLGGLSYAYDPTGLVTSVAGSFARTGLPEPVASATYDPVNRLTAWGGTSLSYDAAGNLTSDGSTTYAWDARGQLASFSGAVSASFAYDPFGRRVARTVGAQTTRYLYDGENPVQELSGTGAPTANLLTGLGMDEFFTRTDSSGSRAFLTDALGSTVALTDPSGAVGTSYTYEPFGAVAASGEASANPFQFTGRENDGTGLYHYRARYYHPTSGRFISGDPVGFGAGDVNLYAYVGSSPANFVDPTGTIPVAAGGACLIGGLVNVVFAGRKDILRSAVGGCVGGLAMFGAGKLIGLAVSSWSGARLSSIALMAKGKGVHPGLLWHRSAFPPDGTRGILPPPGPLPPPCRGGGEVVCIVIVLGSYAAYRISQAIDRR